MKKFSHKKFVLIISIFIFILLVFLNVSGAQAISACSIIPGEAARPATECNGHGLAGWGMIQEADIATVEVTAHADGTGVIDQLVLNWIPRLGGDTHMAAWHHWEVRYSEVNGKDGHETVLSYEEESDPYLYSNRIFYQEPSYNVGDPLLEHATGYVPRAFDGEPHTAIIDGAELEKIRNRIVKFQVIEWYYEGIHTTPSNVGDVYSVIPRSEALYAQTPQQVLTAVTPPIALNDLKPNFTVTFSNTNNLTGSPDITTNNVSLTTATDSSGTHKSATISANVKTGEEYLVHSWENQDIYGNILTREPVTSEVVWADTNNIARNRSVASINVFPNPGLGDLSNLGILSAPRNVDADTVSYAYDIVKKYILFPNSADYEGEKVASFAPPPGSSQGALEAMKDLGTEVNHDLLVHVNYENKYPQLEVEASSCDPAALAGAPAGSNPNIFVLKSENNDPAKFSCIFKALNPNSNTDSYKLAAAPETNPPVPSWMDLSAYPANAPVNYGSPVEIPISVLPSNLQIEGRAEKCENSQLTGKSNLTVKAETIPGIAEPLKIATDVGLTSIDHDGDSFINMFNTEIRGKERAGTDCGNGRICNRQAGVDLTGQYSPPTCKLSSSSTQINAGESAILSWSTAGNPDLLTIDNGIGSVSPVTGGSTSVRPVITPSQTYTMTVANKYGTCSCSQTINVITTNNLIKEYCNDQGKCVPGGNGKYCATDNDCPTPPPIPEPIPLTFNAIFIAAGSVTINRTEPLTIRYDLRFLNTTPPGFGDLLAPLWKEK